MVNEWTADDLPRIGAPDPAQDSVVEGVLDAVLHWLNKHHPKSASRGDAALADHLGRQAEAIDELQLDLEAAERDRARWRRAHEIVEAERDQAREQRAVAERERNDLRRQVEDLTERRQNLVRERDLDAKLAKCMSDFQDMEDECDMWRARAEAAEARTAPAVTKRELRSVVAAHDPGDDELAVSRVNALTDRLWSLVSGADPAVHVVRESEVAAVEVRRASDGWYADGAWIASADGAWLSSEDETAEWVRDRAAEMVVCAARNEAVARAIKAGQAVDPVEELAGQIESATRDAIRQVCDTFATVAPTLDPLAVEQAMEVTAASRKIAAHVLGQEDNLNAEFETTREHTTDTRYVHLPCPHCGWHP